jgi:hypothetical protein
MPVLAIAHHPIEFGLFPKQVIDGRLAQIEAALHNLLHHNCAQSQADAQTETQPTGEYRPGERPPLGKLDTVVCHFWTRRLKISRLIIGCLAASRRNRTTGDDLDGVKLGA